MCNHRERILKKADKHKQHIITALANDHLIPVLDKCDFFFILA